MHESGFSWLAGLILLVWALQRRLYWLAGVGIVLPLGFNLVATWLQFSAAVQLGMFALQFVTFGALANRFHRVLLERSGWRVTAEEPAPGVAR